MRPLIIGLWLALAPACFAKPPDGITSDLALHEWFESLEQPGSSKLCCSESDCRFAAFGIRDGNYEVAIEGYRYVVPSQAIIAGIFNPTGKAVVCYTFSRFRAPASKDVVLAEPQDVADILCFIPPRPPS
ncbi:MAG TPA: hypothetical protein VN702_18360 [Acetobacteraceae bacterium]|nr:hypothetical protein [Acetobacteraceae bacterium]